VNDPGYKMSHAEFVLAYENGRVGCSVSVLITLRLFLVGKIREKRVSIHLRVWLLAITALTAASVIGFLKFPAVWALLGTIAVLAIYTVAFFYSVGGLVLSASLANQEFYEFATEERILWIYSDDEENAPKVRKSQSS
jgi:hypothetical protein